MQLFTADGEPVEVGSLVFNYYDRAVGVIATAPDEAGWFDLRQNDGTKAYLNEERICSIAHARKMGWVK